MLLIPARIYLIFYGNLELPDSGRRKTPCLWATDDMIQRRKIARVAAMRYGIASTTGLNDEVRYQAVGGEPGHRCRELPRLSVPRAAQYLKEEEFLPAVVGIQGLRKRYWRQHLLARGYWAASGGKMSDEE